jgi:hypothetical protein
MVIAEMGEHDERFEAHPQEILGGSAIDDSG